MGNKGTTLMILIVTFLALGLTLHGERSNAKNKQDSIVLEASAPNNYKITKIQVED